MPSGPSASGCLLSLQSVHTWLILNRLNIDSARSQEATHGHAAVVNMAETPTTEVKAWFGQKWINAFSDSEAFPVPSSLRHLPITSSQRTLQFLVNWMWSTWFFSCNFTHLQGGLQTKLISIPHKVCLGRSTHYSCWGPHSRMNLKHDSQLSAQLSRHHLLPSLPFASPPAKFIATRLWIWSGQLDLGSQMTHFTNHRGHINCWQSSREYGYMPKPKPKSAACRIIDRFHSLSN